MATSPRQRSSPPAPEPPRMPGRKNPEPTEQEKEQGYRLQQRRSQGDSVVGDEAEFLEGKGAAGEVKDRREQVRGSKEGLLHEKDSHRE